MSRWKIPATRLLHLRLPFLLVLTVFCVPVLLYVFDNQLEDSVIAYLAYVLSAYLLLLWCLCAWERARRIKAAIHRHPFGKRYLTDLMFRGHLSLYISTGINFCYALFKLTAGIHYRSFWFGAIAVYYLILTAARLLLLNSVRQKEPNGEREHQSARLCGLLLFALNLALSVVSIQMVLGGKGYTYPGYLIFVVALYTFYAITSAVVKLIRFRKLHSPVLLASKVLGLATALVSMLSLQTAMFASFGGASAFQYLMNALTGAAVCVLISLMAIWMIVRENRAITLAKRTREGNG